MALDVAELRQRIAAAGLNWVAAETDVSAVPVADDAGLFGLNITVEQAAQARRNADWAQRHFLAVQLPKRIDWRDHNGQDWLSPVRDQVGCGACVAFATTAVLEARVRIHEDQADLPLELSTAHLFFGGAGRACGKGWDPEAALLYLRDGPGVGREADFPYRPTNQKAKAIASVVKVVAYDMRSDQNARKQAIAIDGPVIAGMRVFDDFRYYRGGGPYKHVDGAFLGLHAVAVVGYDDDQQAWIVRNSWNTGWGDNGYGLVAFGECGIDSEFVFYDPEVDYRPEGFP